MLLSFFLLGIYRRGIYPELLEGLFSFNLFKILQGLNYGIHAQAGNDFVNRPDYAGYFNGDICHTGDFYGPSDINLKTYNHLLMQ